MLKRSARDPNMAKPSWCLAVMTKYFMPASAASSAHASASKPDGSNPLASPSYSETGMRALNMIHSPIPGYVVPFHSPAGTA